MSESYLAQLGIRKSNRPPITYACELCRDSGWRSVPDGGAGRAFFCECRLSPSEEVIDQRLLDAGLYPKDVDSSKKPWLPAFAGQPLPDPSEAFAWFEKEALQARSSRPSLLLHGLPGLGKSKVAAMIARQWVARQYREKNRGLYWSYWSADLKRTVTEEGMEERMIRADFLVIDDASKGLNEWGLDVLERVVDGRQGFYRPTAITINGTGEAFRATLVSRLRRAVMVPFEGEIDMRIMP